MTTADTTALEAPAYSPALAARLTTLQTSRVQRWLRGYEYLYSKPGASGAIRRRQQPVLVRANALQESPFASFLDLIDLLFVKQFLDAGVSLQKLRKALDEASRLIGGGHFAQRVFWTDGKEIYLRLQQKSVGLVHLLSHGQWVIAPVIEQFATRIVFAERTGLARRWYPMGKRGLVVLDPTIAFGMPTIEGCGIATENIFDLYNAERERIRPVASWMGLSARQVQAAVAFERNLRAA